MVTTQRLAAAAVVLLALGGMARAQGLPVEYALIAQRPDSWQAVQCPASPVFAAGCSAFTASTVGLDFPTLPVRWVKFEITMTAHGPDDAVRLRAYRWERVGETWTTPSELWAGLAPALLEAPRTVGVYLDPAWWASRPPGETVFVLEMRGSPTIFGAKLRVLYELGGRE